MIRVHRPTPEHRDVSPLGNPHKRLMAAVLQTVIDDCWGTARRRAEGWPAPDGPSGVRRAIAYVTSTDRAWPFSFENLCDALSLDARRVRRALTKELEGRGTAAGVDEGNWPALRRECSRSSEWPGTGARLTEIVAP